MIKNAMLLVFLLFPIILSAQSEGNEARDAWVEEQYKALSLKEKIGQLMMIRAHSDLGPEHIAKVEGYIKEYAVGGLCFFQGTPEKQAELINKYQALSKLPLMVSMDAEWGLGMRMKKSTISFPKQLTMGAITDDQMIYEMGREIGKELLEVGVQVNFAPVADINNNPDNPVINYRSFGEDRFQVASKSYLYTKGMQDVGVMACAKHFPGHGDTDVDSHEDLPVISHDMDRLDSLELKPFEILFEKGIQSVMVAHLHVPIIDSTKNMPTTLSPKAVNELLRKKMGFEGVIFTDGLGMKGVTKHHAPGVLEAKALSAGNDILLLPQDLKATLSSILAYLKDGRYPKAQFTASVKRVLAAKYDLGLSKKPAPIVIEGLRARLNNPKAYKIRRTLLEKALTLVRDEGDLVPFQNLKNKKVASLSLGSKDKTLFQERLEDYHKMDHFNTGKEITDYQRKTILTKLADKDIVIIGLHDISSRGSKNYGLSQSQLSLLATINERTEVVLAIFGNPYSLRYFDSFKHILITYEENEVTQDVAAQALFGALAIDGRLPVTASPKSNIHSGINRASLQRLGYAAPEDVGLDSRVLAKIDELAKTAIDTKATPGCVVLVAKDGKIVYQKGYGHHTYANAKKVQKDDIYDLASITKILSGTLSTMKLVEENKVDIHRPLQQYLSSTTGTNKQDLKLFDIMAHRARLKGWIKFYESTISSKAYPLPEFYQRKYSKEYSLPVTERLFLKSDYPKTIQRKIMDSELRPNVAYKYSDLGFYMVADMVLEQTGIGIDEYVSREVFQPLGLENIQYNPWKEKSLSRVPPTEVDKYFRRQTIHGYVHDMGAAMLGGISGHAGLFGSAQDVAALMQLFLNNGYYAGKQILQAETIATFTQRHPSCTRRGIGFDMKELDATKSQNMCASASDRTFGHLGFTGTCTWADPEHNLIYVFLSNRTYPSMKNNKLGEENYRPKIQETIYEALNLDPS